MLARVPLLNGGQVMGRNLAACAFHPGRDSGVIRFICQKMGPRNTLAKVQTSTSVMLRN